MNPDTNRHLSREVEDALRAYLQQVETRLKTAGSDLSESRAILDDLETQIRAQLMEKGVEPTWNDLTAILSKMDSPDKFGTSIPVRPARNMLKWVRLALVAVAVLGGLAAVMKSKPGSVASPSGQSGIVELPRGNTVSAEPAEIVQPPTANPAPEAPVVTTPVSMSLPAPAVPPEPEMDEIPVAVASFSSAANVREADTVRRAVVDGLVSYLSQFNGVRVVERERISEALQDLRMSSEGMIDQATALQLGKMTGARVIVTGNIFQIDDELAITARLINTETSELVATRVTGARGNLLAVSDALAAKVADRLIEEEGVLGRTTDRSEQRAARQRQELQQKLQGMNLPRLLVLLPESHLNRIVPDPAGETELVEWLLACGFPVASAEYAGIEAPTPTAQWDSETDVRIRRPNVRDGVQWLISSRSIFSFVTGGMSKDADKLLEIADVLILGQGLSERASTRSGIQSCKARLELKAIDIKTGEVLLAKSTYGAGLDVAEHIAGKRALQAAGRQMALDLLPALAKRWTEIRPSVPAKGTP